jgi:hypothetical protein
MPRRFVDAGGVPSLSEALCSARIRLTVPGAAGCTPAGPASFEDSARREAGLWMPKATALAMIVEHWPWRRDVDGAGAWSAAPARTVAGAASLSMRTVTRALERLVFGLEALEEAQAAAGREEGGQSDRPRRPCLEFQVRSGPSRGTYAFPLASAEAVSAWGGGGSDEKEGEVEEGEEEDDGGGEEEAVGGSRRS